MHFIILFCMELYDLNTIVIGKALEIRVASAFRGRGMTEQKSLHVVCFHVYIVELGSLLAPCFKMIISQKCKKKAFKFEPDGTHKSWSRNQSRFDRS